MSENSPNHSVFYSESGKRWRHFRSLWILFAVITTLFAAVFVVSVLINPFLPQVRLKPNSALPQSKDIIPATPEKPITRHEATIKNGGNIPEEQYREVLRVAFDSKRETSRFCQSFSDTDVSGGCLQLSSG